MVDIIENTRWEEMSWLGLWVDMGSKAENLGLHLGPSNDLAVWSWTSHSPWFLVCRAGRLMPEVPFLQILKCMKTLLSILNNIFHFPCGWNDGKEIRKIINLNKIHLYVVITLGSIVCILRFLLSVFLLYLRGFVLFLSPYFLLSQNPHSLPPGSSLSLTINKDLGYLSWELKQRSWASSPL